MLLKNMQLHLNFVWISGTRRGTEKSNYPFIKCLNILQLSSIFEQSVCAHYFRGLSR
jgi:hypothetical protein